MTGLLHFARAELRAAMATRLALIAFNCAVALAGPWWSGIAGKIPLDRVVLFTIFGIAGMLAGQYGGRRLPRHAMRTAFAVLLAVLGLFTGLHTAFAG